MKIIIEHFLIYQFVYIFFFISLIPIIFAVFTKKKTLKLVFLVIFSIFIAIGFIELVLSLKNKRNISYLEYPKNTFVLGHLNTHQIREIHVIKKTGQKGKYENRAPYTDETVIYDHIATKYANGFRYTKCNLKSNENYIFLGCSYAFGAGLNDDQTLPYYFSKLMNFEKNVLNCGISGRSSNSAISILESDIINQFTDKNSHTKYIIYYMIPDHIYRNFRISGGPTDNWQYKNNKWKRVAPPLGVFNFIVTKSRLFINIYQDMLDTYGDRYCENYMIKSLQRIETIGETKYKSKLVIIIGQECLNIPLFIDKLKKTNLDIIYLPEYFNTAGYKIEGDGHPSAKSNEELANILKNHINEN